jgi:CRP-like cAMP-binding protein
VGQHPFQDFMVRFKRGATVFEEGQKGRTMFIVQSGLVGLYQRVNGDHQLLGQLEKGDFFGEMSILEGLPRTVSARAEDDVELIEINHTVFDKMIRGNIEIAVRMLRKLSIRLREAESRVAELQAGGLRPARPVRAVAERNRRRGRSSSCTNGARLEVEGQDVAYPLEGPATLIGRFDPVTQLKPDIDLTELDLRRTVSRQHARVLHTEEGYLVTEEAGALNGTLVNETRLTAGQPHALTDGDRLSLGSVCLVFRA